MRPLEPVELAEHQRVTLTIQEPRRPRAEVPGELLWLEEHANEYLDEWVALDGNRLVAHGTDARTVYDEARRLGVGTPLMHRPSPRPAPPEAFWL